MSKIQDIEIGDQIIIDKELREVTDFILNEHNMYVVIWKSKCGCGACLPSTWTEWKNGEGFNY